MSGLLNIVVIVAVVAIVLVRQFQAQRVSDSKKWWLIPVVLTVLALREPGLLDPAHQAASVVLLVVGLLIGLAGGAAWAWTTKMWTDEDGAVWTKGGRATVFVWLAGLAVRLGVVGVGVLMGVHQGTPATMLSVAAMLLTRSGITVWKARSALPTYRVPVGG
ncbi:CcdC protein domain-containing protein [Streptomyces pinistramenti]|uniref:CcdC protein domain-containing protein n=1 Tax=Streptomyces pinistramenti TaxID=2884812 RepID=UPI001D078D5E|nr:CcdC protein domain-containing protein [Streptomyces pinistramenti]MCB5906439.1 DUF1453 family protein [Streptomyces pinistramenti]